MGLHRAGQLVQAAVIYQSVLKLEPRNFDALHLTGVIAAQMKNAAKAVQLIRFAIDVDPSNAALYAALTNLGSAFTELENLEQAVECFDRSIALNARYTTAHLNRGSVLMKLGRLEAALSSYDFAVLLEPELAESHFRRGTALQKLGRPHEALASYDQAIKLKADSAASHLNRGNVLRELGRWQAALRSYNDAIVLNPAFAEAHSTKATLLLLLGDFQNGWPEYHWRWRQAAAASTVRATRAFSAPLWLGMESLAEKTILLYFEQGIGDEIQFCRYAKLVADRGARVLLETREPLIKLFGSLEGVSQLILAGAALPEFDFHCPLMTLPWAFKTDLQNVPSWTQYLKSEPGKLEHWRSMLGPRRKPRVGLVWRGNPDHVNDRNRSIRLADLIRHLPPDLEYVSLQKELREDDAALLHENTTIGNYAELLHDFSDTAALCEIMDLVISVDTSVAHLSAALGQATWILLPFNPDWRWSLKGQESPWYPTARLYRQNRVGDWSGVFQRLTADLLHRFEGENLAG